MCLNNVLLSQNESRNRDRPPRGIWMFHVEHLATGRLGRTGAAVGTLKRVEMTLIKRSLQAGSGATLRRTVPILLWLPFRRRAMECRL